GIDETRLFDDGVDVALEREGHDVGAKPVDHRLGLLARATMALLQRNRLARRFLPVLGEGLVEGDIELAGRVVRHVEQLVLGADSDRTGESERGDETTKRENSGRFLHHVLLVKSNYGNSTVLVGFLKEAA